MMRLDKYLAERTGMTRSESRKAITKGRISVDGAICRKADAQLDENTAAVALDGTPLAGAYQKFVYIMLNKPEGVVSASRDKKRYHCGGSGRGGLSAAGSCSPPGGWTRPAPALCC